MFERQQVWYFIPPSFPHCIYARSMHLTNTESIEIDWGMGWMQRLLHPSHPQIQINASDKYIFKAQRYSWVYAAFQNNIAMFMMECVVANKHGGFPLMTPSVQFFPPWNKRT